MSLLIEQQIVPCAKAPSRREGPAKRRRRRFIKGPLYRPRFQLNPTKSSTEEQDLRDELLRLKSVKATLESGLKRGQKSNGLVGSLKRKINKVMRKLDIILTAKKKRPTIDDELQEMMRGMRVSSSEDGETRPNSPR